MAPGVSERWGDVHDVSMRGVDHAQWAVACNHRDGGEDHKSADFPEVSLSQDIGIDCLRRHHFSRARGENEKKKKRNIPKMGMVVPIGWSLERKYQSPPMSEVRLVQMR